MVACTYISSNFQESFSSLLLEMIEIALRLTQIICDNLVPNSAAFIDSVLASIDSIVGG